MAKKQKEEITNVNATANRDIIQRLNFLHQASLYLQSVAPSTSPKSKGKGREPEGKHNQEDVIEPMEVDTHRPPGSINEGKSKKNKAQRKHSPKQTTGDLARSYIECMRVVGQKTTVKIDPCLKRSLCTGCSSILVPGSSASIRVKRSSGHGHIMIYTCLHCRTQKRIPAPPNGLYQSPNTIVESTNPTSTSLNIPSTSETMPISQEVESETERQPQNQRRSVVSKPLPLFARPNAGHVVFRGNERLALDEESGFGVLFS